MNNPFVKPHHNDLCRKEWDKKSNLYCLSPHVYLPTHTHVFNQWMCRISILQLLKRIRTKAVPIGVGARTSSSCKIHKNHHGSRARWPFYRNFRLNIFPWFRAHVWRKMVSLTHAIVWREKLSGNMYLYVSGYQNVILSKLLIAKPYSSPKQLLFIQWHNKIQTWQFAYCFSYK